MWQPLEGRILFAVPVNVAGVTSAGQAFSETVYTIDVSRRGVRLDRARFRRKPGDHVTLRYGNRSARYRIVWIGAPDSPEPGQAGLVLMEGEPYLWGSQSPDRQQHAQPRTNTLTSAESKDEGGPQSVFPPLVPPAQAVVAPVSSTSVPSGGGKALGAQRPLGQERRATPRYVCDRAVLCWKEGERAPRWGKLRDVSLGGCFVETPLPFEAGATISLLLMLYGYKIHARAEVRVHRAGTGMGLRFVSIPAEDRHRLQTVLERLSAPDAERSGMMRSDDASALRQLRAWFESHATLEREQFYRLLNRPKPDK